MSFVVPGAQPDPHDPTASEGLSYDGFLVNADHDSLLRLLGELRFSGWVGPQEDDWVVVVPDEVSGAVAGDGVDAVRLGAIMARRLETVAVLARVERDRVLRLDGWDGTERHGRQEPSVLGSYVSDPSVDSGEEDTYPEPVGAHHAPDYAAACGRPEVGDELTEVLAEELDGENVFESERLDSVLRLLELPRWLVSVDALPGNVPGGPRRSEVVRLGAGRSGAGGIVAGAVSSVLRRRRR